MMWRSFVLIMRGGKIVGERIRYEKGWLIGR